MRTYEFFQLDVFTDRRFAGNPLAVFPEADGIEDAEMQPIAAEMNLSETVFVLPSNRALRRLRIFTPRRELPLAGHPVVGTWNLLAGLGVTPREENGAVTIEQELNLGVLPVEIMFSEGNPAEVFMTQDRFRPGAIIDGREELERLAGGLGLDPDDLFDSAELPARVVSTGVNSLAVPVRSLEALGRCRIDPNLLTGCYLPHDAVGVYAWTFETKEPGSRVHARFFAPDDNIPEDPATGSAAGALSGYLIHQGAVEPGRFRIEQGDFMDRPSRITAEVSGEAGRVGEVRIGGASVLMARGEMHLD